MELVQFAYGGMGNSVLSTLIEDTRFHVSGVILPPEGSELCWHSKLSPQETRAEEQGIKILRSNKLADIHEFIKKISPDIVVIASFNKILPPEILDLSDFVNIHHGDLPEGRGRAGVNWAIINGAPNVKVSIHIAVPELDAGPILRRIIVSIEPGDSSACIYKKINGHLCHLLPDVLSDFKSGHLQPYPQDERPATYNCTRLPEDGLIDWSSSRDNIINLINALAPPYPRAYTFLNGKKFSIKKATTSDARTFEGIVCGRVTFLNSDGSVEVLASDGAILILEAEYDGEVGPPGKWIKSVKTTLGINLGNLLTRMSALEAELSNLSKKVEDFCLAK